MRKKGKGVVVAAVVVLAVALILTTLFIIFSLRAPVIIVTEQFFIDLYGEKRLKNDVYRVSFTLLRPVKIAVVANDAGDDIVPFAVSGISANPYCVLFPRRFANSAKNYAEQNPQTVTILLEGRNPVNFAVPGLFVYGSDTEDDFYRAGLTAAAVAASASNEETKGKIAVFLPAAGSGSEVSGKEAFLRGVNEEGIIYETLFYSSYTDISETQGLACVVLAGLGGELLEKIQGIPVITFTWLDPSMVTSNVILVIDDSPIAQMVQAVNMAMAEKWDEGSEAAEKALLKSKFIFSESENFDFALLQNIRKMK